MQFVEWFVCVSILSFQGKHYVLICVLSSLVLDHYPFSAADATIGTLMVYLMNIVQLFGKLGMDCHWYVLSITNRVRSVIVTLGALPL